MPDIHRTAIVEDGAELADDVVVGAFSFVGPQVKIGAATILYQGVILEGDTHLGTGNELFPYCVLGTIPQDKKYDGEAASLRVGDDNVIREHVTIHIGTSGGGGETRIGNKNLFMVGSHVGHDCQIGNHCILANTTGLAGHVLIEDYAILGGQTGVHQYVQIGAHAMTSGGSKVNKNVPPFTIVQGYPARLRGINQVGLKRRGFSDETVKLLRQAYRAVFFDTQTPRFEDLLVRVRSEFPGSAEVGQFLDFLATAQSSARGFVRPDRNGQDGVSSGIGVTGV